MLGIPIIESTKRRPRVTGQHHSPNGRPASTGRRPEMEEDTRLLMEAAAYGELRLSLIDALLNRYGYTSQAHAEGSQRVPDIRTMRSHPDHKPSNRFKDT